MTSSSAAATALHGLRACSSHGSATVCVRDPRVAPRSTQKNVTIPETCEFYGVKDAISGCRYPRSCRDCLAMEGCFLSGMGICLSMDKYSDADRKVDYRSHIDSTHEDNPFNSTASNSTFIAGNATYCSADDKVCTRCIHEFHQLALPLHSASSRIDSQFCLGDNGCVCIAACEVPQVRDQMVYDVSCDQTRPVILDPTRDVAMLNLTTKRLDPRAPRRSRLVQTENYEPCAYYDTPDIRGCRRPRTCQDCLQREGCAIRGYECVDMMEYAWERDFRLAHLGDYSNASKAGLRYYPSTNTTYCSGTDPSCTKYRRELFESDAYVSTSGSPDMDSIFCVGTNGCVCIEGCESSLWSKGMADRQCRRISARENSSVVGWTIFFVVATFIVGRITYSRYTKRRTRVEQQVRQAAQVVFRNMLDAVPPFRLDLFGWRGFHQRLLDKETQLLQGEEALSPVTHPIDFMFAHPSAPDFEEDESSAPTASDPRALASAPVYRIDDGDEDPSERVAESAPSAPWLDYATDDATNDLLVDQNCNVWSGDQFSLRSRRR